MLDLCSMTANELQCISSRKPTDINITGNNARRSCTPKHDGAVHRGWAPGRLYRPGLDTAFIYCQYIEGNGLDLGYG